MVRLSASPPLPSALHDLPRFEGVLPCRPDLGGASRERRFDPRAGDAGVSGDVVHDLGDKVIQPFGLPVLRAVALRVREVTGTRVELQPALG